MSKDEQTRSESQDAVVNQRHAQRTPECPSEVIKDSKELTLAHSITTGIDWEQYLHKQDQHNSTNFYSSLHYYVYVIKFMREDNLHT